MFFLPTEIILSLHSQLVNVGLTDSLIAMMRFNPNSQASTIISKPYVRIPRLSRVVQARMEYYGEV
jgi:hypothetical protein